MNGTTRCPLCDTRFKISEAQLTAHQGMVRCGNCQQAFDARPGFIAEQSQADLTESHVAIEEQHTVPVHETSAGITPNADTVPEVVALAEHHDDAVSAESTEFGDFHLPIQPEHDDTLDFSYATRLIADRVKLAETFHDEEIHVDVSMPQAEPVEHVDLEEKADLQDVAPDEMPDHFTSLPVEQVGYPPDDSEVTDDFLRAGEADESSGELHVKRRTWPWTTGIIVSAILLIAQSAYFFRVGIASSLPALKPALVNTCHLFNCSVPLPQNPDLMSIESSGLDADTEHENRITLNALLRNRASFTLAYPVLALTLNDVQDKPLARRLFLPTEYLPPEENEQSGFAVNHEVSVKLHLSTADLKPSGYRLELFYSQSQP